MNLLKNSTMYWFLEKNTFKKIMWDVREVIFWFILLGISLLFIQIHGPIRVSDGYYEYAELLRSQIFYGSNPAKINPNNNIAEVRFRIIYPLLVAMSSGLFNIGLFEAGVVISLISGAGCIFYSSKLVSLVLEDEKAVRSYRMAIGTFIGFIIYWAKFATDMLFCFFALATLFSIIEFWKKGHTIGNIIQYCLWTSLAIFTRELGIFLIIPMLFALTKDKQRGVQIKLTGLIIIGFILAGMIYFIIRWKYLVNSYGWLYYFYHDVWSFDVPNASIQFGNLSTVFSLLMNFYFSPTTFFAIFSSFLYTTSIVVPLLFIIFVIEKKLGLLTLKLSWDKNKPLLLYLSFIIPYLIVLFILQARFMNERYLLLLIPFSLLLLAINVRETMIKLNKNNQLTLKWLSEKKLMLFLISTNLLILVIRIAYLMIFS